MVLRQSMTVSMLNIHSELKGVGAISFCVIKLMKCGKRKGLQRNTAGDLSKRIKREVALTSGPWTSASPAKKQAARHFKLPG
jgi:hypothetical protein